MFRNRVAGKSFTQQCYVEHTQCKRQKLIRYSQQKYALRKVVVVKKKTKRKEKLLVTARYLVSTLNNKYKKENNKKIKTKTILEM